MILLFSGRDKYGHLSPHNYEPSQLSVKILVELPEKGSLGGSHGSLGGVKGYHLVWGDPPPIPYGARVTDEMLDAQCVYSDNAGKTTPLGLPTIY